MEEEEVLEAAEPDAVEPFTAEVEAFWPMLVLPYLGTMEGTTLLSSSHMSGNFQNLRFLSLEHVISIC